MPLFSYSGRQQSGSPLKGRIEASSREHALQQLHQQGIVITQLNEPVFFKLPTPSGTGGSLLPQNLGPQGWLDYFGFTGVSQKDLAIWTRKFAQLLKAGLGYGHIFSIMNEETDNRRLKAINHSLGMAVANGDQLTPAFRLHPTIFPPIMISMIRAGEVAGRLDHIMLELAKVYDSEVELRQKIMSRMYYPIGLLIVALLLIGGFIFFVPRLLGPEIGATFGLFFNAGLYMSVLLMYVVIAVLLLAIRTQPGYRVFRTTLAYVPYIGILLKKLSLIRFCRLMAAMWASGVPLLEALDVAEETVAEPYLKAGVREAASLVQQGEDLTEALRASGVFPGRVLSMVRTGEIAGDLEIMLVKIAEYYELEAEAQGNIVGTVGYFVIYGIVAFTIGMFVIKAYTGYFGILDGLMNF